MTELQWAPTPVEPLSGGEPFKGLDATVIDFWKWGFSDLRMNIVRGILAEFLVAQAVGDKTDVRVAWANFDVTTQDGVPVEVKSSGHCQSWKQRRLSRLNFRKLTGRRYSEDGELGAEPEIRADVIVFAVQACRDCARYEALDIAKWEFLGDPGNRDSKARWKICWHRLRATNRWSCCRLVPARQRGRRRGELKDQRPGKEMRASWVG